MAEIQYSTAFIIDKRHAKADKTYPVKLRLTWQRIPYYYGTVFSLTEKDFKDIKSGKHPIIHKDIIKKLKAVETKADGIIKDLPEFSFNAFADKWYTKPVKQSDGDPRNIFFQFERCIKDMERQNRIGNASAYRCAMTSFKEYAGTDNLPFNKITVQYLKDYEADMLTAKKTKKANNLTTVGIYLRCVRALYKSAVNDGIVRPELYPFGSLKNKKYCIPAPHNIKKSIPLPEIKKIFDYKPTTEAESMYRDLWVFSYLCNGANMKDVCKLKFSNIDGATISFYRQKTANTNREPKTITAAYNGYLKAIVERWGNTPEPDNFIFPFLNHSDNERQIKERVAEVVKQVNKYIDRIAKATGIPCKVTTYTARHSFATTLRNAGVNVSFISDSLGHANIATTENYLGRIEDGTRTEISEHLTKF
jgi:integrase/recombinase XerD